MKRWLFTSESVTEGHPDKVADQISDAILDAMLEQDPNSRVAILDIGYTRAKYGFDGETCAVLSSIDEQSPDIALGVNRSLEAKSDGNDRYDEIGAGDQGMMFGYATNETEEMMPLPVLAHKLSKRLSDVRKKKLVNGFRPDGKTQVTVLYEDGKPVGVTAVVVSTQHDPTMTSEEIREAVIEHVIKPIIPESLTHENMEIYVNPTGRFVKGGPAADTGLTGRTRLCHRCGSSGFLYD